MRSSAPHRLFVLLHLAVALITLSAPARADGDLNKVKHVIIVMQENHSFDNYFGALAYAPGSPYHNGNGPCREGDHRCVDGLTCRVDPVGRFTCGNANLDDDGSLAFAFHDPNRCVAPDLDHSWVGTHKQVNFDQPNRTLTHPRSDGFVRVNDATEQIDRGESPTDDETMGFYNQDEIPFYYDLAGKFAINDRYFASVLGPTFPNRSYLLAATSFGHLTTSDTFPPPGGYKPITGTIFDLLESHNVTWADYFQDAPQGGSFRAFSATAHDPHFLPLTVLLAQLQGVPTAGPLPQVAFVYPNFGLFGARFENDEHPATDIQRGQAFVSQVIAALRNSPYWKDSVLFLTYDEHGGFYDHVRSPRAPQQGALNPDGINPGQCEDLSNPPFSTQPGGGAECSANLLSATDTSVKDAEALCPELALDPTGPYPRSCANFDQLGVRVPFLAVSAFSKPHYVSHTVGDHTSMLAFVEEAFMTPAKQHDEQDRGHDGDRGDDDRSRHPHLTRRDGSADPLTDMFDFDRAPSLNTAVGVAAAPAKDCTPQ